MSRVVNPTDEIDRLISDAMHYNECLYSDKSLSDFDCAARKLCASRKKLIKYLKQLA